MHLERDGIRFNFRDEGTGQPFVYQHGLGGDVSQPFGFFAGTHAGLRLLGIDCRAHGETRPLGPVDKISIESFADDVIALMDFRGIDRAVVGGISMGAAISLNIALRYPERVRALILQRPAWLDQPMPPNLRVLVTIGELIRSEGTVKGRETFVKSEAYAALMRESPDGAAAMLAQFAHPRAAETAVKLVRIPHDSPCSNRAWKTLRLPVLVIVNRMDPIHPLEFGQTLAKGIPGAVSCEVTPKSISIERHTSDVRKGIEDFIEGLPV
ncbi:MAG TPA: alpha/beta hydrolase [Candidatus Hydrogenedentes bacterium]|nr:alpha/beta hydrolase [Candidatus Hydrogenedentota bacterium]HRK34121.1 alpha/beta hydrolase [Candidatus Hydrogenedentota bacterium]